MIDPADEPKAFVAFVKDVEAWAGAAQPGDIMVYARCVALPAGSLTAAAVRRLIARGKVGAHIRRGAGGILEYVMRVKAPPPPRPRRPTMSPAPSRGGHHDAARVMRVLELCVERGMVCPCNERLAYLAGVGSADRARYGLRLLAKAKMIESEIVDDATGARIVTLCATGRRTATPPSPQPVREQA